MQVCIPGLPQWVKDPVSLWCRSQMQLGPGLAMLWHRPVATAPIQPLAWKPQQAAGAALKRQKRKKKKKEEKSHNTPNSKNRPQKEKIFIRYITIED